MITGKYVVEIVQIRYKKVKTVLGQRQIESLKSCYDFLAFFP